MCLKIVIGQKDLINIRKHKYQINNTFKVNIRFDFFFLSCDHNIYVVIITRLFNKLLNPIQNDYHFITATESLLSDMLSTIHVFSVNEINYFRHISHSFNVFLNPIQKALLPLTSFSPVTSANVGIIPQDFLTFSFNPFVTLA